MNGKTEGIITFAERASPLLTEWAILSEAKADSDRVKRINTRGIKPDILFFSFFGGCRIQLLLVIFSPLGHKLVVETMK